MELPYSRMFTQIRAFKNLRKMLTPFARYIFAPLGQASSPASLFHPPPPPLCPAFHAAMRLHAARRAFLRLTSYLPPTLSTKPPQPAAANFPLRLVQRIPYTHPRLLQLLRHRILSSADKCQQWGLAT